MNQINYNEQPSFDSDIESTDETIDEINNLLPQLEHNLDNPKEILPLLNELIKRVNEVCTIYYQNDHYDDIIKLYKLVYQNCTIVKENIKHTPDYPYILPIIKELCNFWKTRIDGLKKNLVKSNILEGSSHLLEGQYEKAISHFKIGLNYDKKNIELLNKIGISFFYLKNFNESINYLEKALQLNPNNINTLYNLALAYEQKGEITMAISLYNKILSIESFNFNSLASLGILYYRTSEYGSAKKYLTKAYKINKNDWKILLALGCTLSEGSTHDYEGAQYYFEKAKKLNPNSFLIKLNISQNLILMEHYKDSEKLLTDIVNRTKDIEDRSTAIITRILLICSIYLNKKEISINYIEELIKYCYLKDLKLVQWNFQNLKNYISILTIDFKIKDFLNLIFSLTESKSPDEKEVCLQKIQASLNDILPIKNTININPIGEKNIKVIQSKAEKLLQKTNQDYDNQEWYKWEISIEYQDDSTTTNTTTNTNNNIDYVQYAFDPSFQNNIQKISYKEDKKFRIKVIGWQKSKVEVEIVYNNKLTIKKYIVLEINHHNS